jgi:16S rRNA (guanine527-N7)-methyltransferase
MIFRPLVPSPAREFDPRIPPLTIVILVNMSTLPAVIRLQSTFMHPDQIAQLLRPFLHETALPSGASILSQSQLNNISTYIDILLRWNARINLTSVRPPEEIVTRHFGESLFAARHLFPGDAIGSSRVIDIGSGAGFPGLPMKIWRPSLHITLIESNQKKATFLREVIRLLALTEVEVFARRAEDFHRPVHISTDSVPDQEGRVVTLRAVEQSEEILPHAVRLARPGGRVALLVGESQISGTHKVAPRLKWQQPVPIPQSLHRVLLIGIVE